MSARSNASKKQNKLSARGKSKFDDIDTQLHDKEIQEQLYWTARNHSCTSFEVCDEFVKKLLDKVGDTLLMKQIDLQRVPCASFQSIIAAQQSICLNLVRHDNQDKLEIHQSEGDFEAEGLIEPECTIKDNYMQESAMLKKPKITVDSSMLEFDEWGRKIKTRRERSFKSYSKSPTFSDRRGSCLSNFSMQS